MKSLISLEELLKRKYFDKAEIISGRKNLRNRQVKWVHVVEVTQISKLLNGSELILTTGLGLKEDSQLFLSFVQQLIDCGAAGLCIEMDTHMRMIPKEVVELAESHQFPLILFLEEVPFVEITQDIHAVLIHQQYELLSKLEDYAQQLNKKLLEIHNHEEILSFLQQYLDVQVVTIFNDNEIEFVPKRSRQERTELLAKINGNVSGNDKEIARQPVFILGKEYAQLIILADRKITDFESLILDRTATALAQHLLRDLYVEEKRLAKDSEWISNWLEGEYDEDAIHEHLSFMYTELKLNGGVVCIYKQKTISRSADLDGSYFKLLFRTIFEQYGFHIFQAEMRHHVLFILGDKRSSDSWKERVNEGFKRLRQVDSSNRINLSTVSMAVGKYVNSLSEINKSYETAKETLRLQETIKEEKRSFFYDDLHLYRIISLTKKHSNLEEIVSEYLDPVIEYDRHYNGNLMDTLKTYLACNGSKQETAKKLFIVRQTLYHRIDKLETLLGNDFMKSDRRVAIEFMLLAHEYLTSTQQNELLQYKM